MLEIQIEKEKRGWFWAMNLTMALNNLETIAKRALNVLGKPYPASKFEDDQTNALKQALDELQKQPLIYQTKIERVFFRTLPHLNKFRQFIEMGGEKSSASYAEKTSSRSKDDATQRYSGRDFTSDDLFKLARYYFKSLVELRNYFAHSEHQYPKLPESLDIKGVRFPSSIENALFNANVRTVKDRFYKDDRKDADEIENGFLCFRPKKTVKSRETVDNPEFKFRLTERNDANGRYYPTQAGLAFFVARFLEKRYVDLLFETTDANGVPVLPLYRPQNVDGVEFSLAPRRVYGLNAARLPRRRVETTARPESSNETLGLDLIGYLARCPKIVYELLSETDRRKFRVAPDESNPSEELRTRSEKRFARLAALCLDRMNCFENLRFQVDMGQYYSATHRRRLIDGTTIDDRRVGKRIFWFERLQNAVDYYRAERLKPESKYFVPTNEAETPPETDYRVDAYPRYRVKNQQLGLRLVDASQKNAPPKLIPWTHSAKRGSAPKTRTKRPEFWLSQYELPALLFVALHGKAQDAQNVIAGYQKNWRRFLEDVRDGEFDFGGGRALRETRHTFESQYGLRFDDLPDSTRALFRSTASDSKELEKNRVDAADQTLPERQIDRLLDETRRRLAVLESETREKFKLGNRKRPSLSVGRVASWLVRDLMRFQYATSEKSFGKIPSSPDFIALQTSLACFESRQNELLAIFKAAKLIPSNFVAPNDAADAFYFADAQNAERSLHPFLGAVLSDAANLRDWKSFYRAYLSHRLNWLRRCDPQELRHTRYGNRRLEKLKNMRKSGKRQTVAQQMATRLLEQPINLPRGLFTDLVRAVVQEHFGDQLAKATQNGATSTNASWLIGKVRDWSGDASQGFYSWRRDYRNVASFKRLFELCGPTVSTSPLDFRALKKAFAANFDANYAAAFAKTDQKTDREDWKRFKREAEDELREEALETTRGRSQRRPFIPREKIEDRARKNQKKFADKQKEKRRAAEHAKIRRLSDAERDIRHTEIQDYVLSLAASYFLFEGDLAKIRLADVYAIIDDATGTVSTNPLRKLRPCEVLVDVPEGGTCKIRGEMNVKNSGNFQRFLPDGRLPSFLRSLRLMKAENAEDLSYIDLANEFAASDRLQRGRIFAAIYRFENACFSVFPELKDKKRGGYVSFATILTSVFPNDEETQYRLLVIRNKFMHQEYPIYDASQIKDKQPKDKQRWAPIFDRWNREMWAEYNPKHGRTLCQCIVDWAKPHFEEATKRVESRR